MYICEFGTPHQSSPVAQTDIYIYQPTNGSINVVEHNLNIFLFKISPNSAKSAFFLCRCRNLDVCVDFGAMKDKWKKTIWKCAHSSLSIEKIRSDKYIHRCWHLLNVRADGVDRLYVFVLEIAWFIYVSSEYVRWSTTLDLWRFVSQLNARCP